MSIRFDDRRWSRRDTMTWGVVIALIIGIGMLQEHAPAVAGAMRQALDVAALVVGMTWILGAALIAAGRQLPRWLVPQPLLLSVLMGLWFVVGAGVRVVAWIAPATVDLEVVDQALKPVHTAFTFAVLAVVLWKLGRGSHAAAEMRERR